MHASSRLRMKWFADQYAARLAGPKIKVLDVGSCDVNGSYKTLFDARRYEYTGLDMAAGPNVDIVLPNPYDWSGLATDSFDVVISGQTFEHIEFFWHVMGEMARVLKPEGLICLIAPNGFHEHRYPVDCYRFFTDGMVALARYTGLEPLHAHTNCAPRKGGAAWYSSTKADAMLVAKKPYAGAPRPLDLRTYQCVPANQPALRGNLVPPRPRVTLRRFWRWLRARARG